MHSIPGCPEVLVFPEVRVLSTIFFFSPSAKRNTPLPPLHRAPPFRFFPCPTAIRPPWRNSRSEFLTIGILHIRIVILPLVFLLFPFSFFVCLSSRRNSITHDFFSVRRESPPGIDLVLFTWFPPNESAPFFFFLLLFVRVFAPPIFFAFLHRVDLKCKLRIAAGDWGNFPNPHPPFSSCLKPPPLRFYQNLCLFFGKIPTP